MNLKNTGKYGVVIQYDNEDLAKMLVVAEHEAIELRDLLLREFPVAAEPAPACHAVFETPVSGTWSCELPKGHRHAHAAPSVRRVENCRDCTATQSAAQPPAPEPSEPDPDEVLRALADWDRPPAYAKPIFAAARAWLRSREQQPKLEAAWSDEVLAFNGKTYADDKARERRERIATAVLAGLVANPRVIQFWPESDIDEFAQRRAHALIKELDRDS